jgi:hypothetical protein
MQSFNIQTSVAVGAFLLALITNIVAVVVWLLIFYANSEKKKYASERDFNHLRNNQKDISNGIAAIAKDFDGRFDDFDKRFNNIEHQLLEIKTYLNIHSRREE